MVTYFLGTGLISGFSVVLDTAASLTELLVDENKSLRIKAKRILDEIQGRDENAYCDKCYMETRDDDV